MVRKRPSGAGQNTPKPAKRPRGRQAKRNVNDGIDENSDDDNRPKHVLLDDEKEEEVYEEEGGTRIDGIYIPPKIAPNIHPGTGNRLVIEKITCVNFKSYAGVKEMGPFHRNFTAIVGPNGNGKSNIIDAMLFVFGYKNSKIRCKKVSVLVHKSDLLTNVQTCSVTVQFGQIYDSGDASEDQDKLNILPGTRIKVSRRITPGGISEYWLQDVKVKFPDVTSFLRKNGIDIVHNRFLILQGEVESIAQMPPKSTNTSETGLMEYLEDIIGTRRYVKCLIQLEERITALDFDREAKLHQVDLAEQEKRSLAVPVKKAKEYLRESNSAIRVEHQLYLAMGRADKKSLEESEQKKTEIEEVLKRINDRLDEIKSSSEEKVSDFKKAEKAYIELETEYKKNKKIWNASDAEYTRITEQLQRANTERKKARDDIKRFQAEIEKLDQIPVKYEENMSTYQKRLDELTELCAAEQVKSDQLCAKLQKKIDTLVIEKGAADKNLMDLKKVFNLKKNAAQAAKSDLEEYKQTEELEHKKFKEYEKELEDTKEKIKGKEKESRTSLGNSNDVEVLGQKIAQKNLEVITLSDIEKAKSVELNKLQSEFQERKEAYEGSNIGDSTYKMFKEEMDQGRLTGLYGRLKDLATIDERYNVAATVQSGQWDYWVCDNDTTAEKCINILKAKKMNYQNFIPLNQIEKHAQFMRQPFKCPAGAQRIFDLLNFGDKPQVKPAFYKILRNGLVANNLNDATIIAYGPSQCRVSTLDGALVDAHGSMTGGGQKIPQGKLNSGVGNLVNKVTKAELEAQNNAMDKCRREVEEIISKRQNLEKEIRNMTREVEQKRIKVATFEVDMKSLKSQALLKENRMKQQELKWKSSILDKKVLKEKEKILLAAEQEYEEAVEPFEKAEEISNKMKEKLHQLQVLEKGEIMRKLMSYQEQKKKVETEIDKEKVAMKNYNKNRAKANEKIESLTKDKEGLEKQIKEWYEKKLEIEESGKHIKETLDKLEGDLKKSKEEVQKLKDASNVFRDEENKLGKEKVSVETKLTNITNLFKNLKQTIKKTEDKLASLKLMDIPEEDVEPLKDYTEEEIDGFGVNHLQAKLDRKKQQLQGKQPNLTVLDTYKDKVEQFLREVDCLDKVTSHRDKVRDAYIKTETQRLSEFMEGYAIISSKLKEMFRMISMGGDAELDLLNKTDPFLEGVELCVRPANKAWKPIKHLSGGEKTLSSLALVFALHHFKPSPFYIMDEIDAALDFKNVSIIANYIKDRTKFTQFIIISLRSNMFELADTLLGVYKVDNMSYTMHMSVRGLMKKLNARYEQRGQRFPGNDEVNRVNRQNENRVEEDRPAFENSLNRNESEPKENEEIPGDKSASNEHEANNLNSSEKSASNEQEAHNLNSSEKTASNEHEPNDLNSSENMVSEESQPSSLENSENLDEFDSASKTTEESPDGLAEIGDDTTENEILNSSTSVMDQN